MGNPAPKPSLAEQALSTTLLAQRLMGPLTVINGHAQLIRRRAHGQGENEAVALERSLVAIELAVRQMLDVLVLASTSDREGRLRKQEDG